MFLMKKLTGYTAAAAILAAVVTSCTPSAKYLREKNSPGTYEQNFVRVLVAVEKKPFTISSESGLRVRLKSGSKLLYEMKSGKLMFYPERINEIFTVESEGSPLCVNGAPYRGTFELHNILGKIHIVNVVNIEEYLYSVVPSEMPASWNIEALKAQAVASRSYIYYYLIKNRSNNIYDVDATTSFQVYKGVSSENKESTLAVDATRSVIMTWNYEPVLAYFHSTSGGRTSDDKYVWKGDDLPYLEAVDCSFGKDSPHYKWEMKLSFTEISSGLGKRYSGVGKITGISFKKHDGRVYEVVIRHSNGTINMSGNEFRLMISPSKMKSTFFSSVKRGSVFYISGRGWGHGVGMCQWGARGRAESGQKYREILTAYYKGVKFARITNNYLAQRRVRGNRVN